MFDIVLDKERDFRSIRIELLLFIFIGVIIRFGDLLYLLRECFGVVFRLSYYKLEEIK